MRTLLILSMACMASMLAFGQTDTNIAASAGGLQYLEPGQPPVMVHPTVQGAQRAREANLAAPADVNLYYHGGIGGIGVETSPQVYIVFWGKQWNGNDPSGEATILQNFLSAVGGSDWLNSVVQYCQGVDTGTEFCNGQGVAAGNPQGVLKGVWYDNATNAPKAPKQPQIASEAVKAAAHFGNTTPASNVNAQYVIALSHGNNSNGFGVYWCAYHGAESSHYGYLAYTNLPYITDAGGACGANYNGWGLGAGISIIGGHEVAETVSDQFPAGGWQDSANQENADKCAWIHSGQGAIEQIHLSTGDFPVQSLWSNAFNGGAGGCVISYP